MTAPTIERHHAAAVAALFTATGLDADALADVLVPLAELRRHAVTAEADNAVLLHTLTALVDQTDDYQALRTAASVLRKPHPGTALLEERAALERLLSRSTEDIAQATAMLQENADALALSTDLLRESTSLMGRAVAAGEAIASQNDVLRATIAAVPTDAVQTANDLLHYQREIERLQQHVTNVTRARSEDRKVAQARIAELEAEFTLWDGRFVECDAINARLVEERNNVEAERNREQAEARRLEAELDELKTVYQDTLDALQSNTTAELHGEQSWRRALETECDSLKSQLDAIRREVSGLPKKQPGGILNIGGPVLAGRTYLVGDALVTLNGHSAIEAQRVVWRNVESRGYAAGYTPSQLIARQMVKLIEEVSEASNCIILDTPHERGVSFDNHAWIYGKLARARFDETNWADCGPTDSLIYPALIKELYDCQVVLCCLASVLSDLAGQPVDLLRGALEKSGADVARGVRGAKDGANSES